MSGSRFFSDQPRAFFSLFCLSNQSETMILPGAAAFGSHAHPADGTDKHSTSTLPSPGLVYHLLA